jgi:hypothetical protein
MATEDLRPRGKKLNNRKSGAATAKKLQKRQEAEERQAKYSKLTIEQKLAQPHLGAKERKKLLARKQT